MNEADEKDLAMIASLLNHKREMKIKKAINKLQYGTKVKFMSRYGRVIFGTIAAVNRKTAIVKPDDGSTDWRVTASLLEVI